MDCHQALLSRRTIHHYEPAPVPREVLERALEAAHQAPNHKLTYPWRFTLIGPRARERIAEVSAALKTAKGPAPTPEALAAIKRKLTDPGAVIAVSCVRCADSFRSREDYGAVACSIENLMLSLWADGFGTKWTTGAVTRDPRTYEILGVDPEKEEMVGFVLAGKPAKQPTPPPRPGYRDYVREVP